jgi:hypothetical protein
MAVGGRIGLVVSSTAQDATQDATEAAPSEEHDDSNWPEEDQILDASLGPCETGGAIHAARETAD